MTIRGTVLPEKFVRTVRATFGERGESWLERLPILLDECEARWTLTLLPAFPNLSFNYVAPVVCADGTEAVLKVGIPHAEFTSEIAALRFYDGRASVRMLDADAMQGVLLLERLRPGTVLTTLADDLQDSEATSIAAGVMRGLWRPITLEQNAALPTPFPTVNDWMQGLRRMKAHFEGNGMLPSLILEEAWTLSEELLASMDAPVLLHGDLHHDNILSSAASITTWRAIDPKGVIGEPAYEVGALMRNLWTNRHSLNDPAALIVRRVWQLSEELGFDRARVRGWGIVQAILSSWWSFEDEGAGSDDWESNLKVAEWIASVKI